MNLEHDFALDKGGSQFSVQNHLSQLRILEGTCRAFFFNSFFMLAIFKLLLSPRVKIYYIFFMYSHRDVLEAKRKEFYVG